MPTHYTWTNNKGQEFRHRIVPPHDRGASNRPRIRVICFENTGNLWQVDEWLSQTDVERGCPVFFRTPHGKRETYTMYRGQLIVRNTVQFTGASPQRMTTVYLVTTHEISRGNWHRKENFETFCLGSDYSNINSAKRAIDRVLESGTDKEA